MDRNTLFAWTLVPLGLLAAAYLIGTAHLWSHTGNYTLPWFCTTLAVCLLLVGGLCLLCDATPDRIPIAAASLFFGGAVMVVGVGMLIHAMVYEVKNDWLASFGEWFGFGAILAGVMFVPRMRDTSTERME
jgi:uncharacterized membrane protein HdeD (DUF308 family)